jgi:hypothetical protein
MCIDILCRSAAILIDLRIRNLLAIFPGAIASGTTTAEVAVASQAIHESLRSNFCWKSYLLNCWHSLCIINVIQRQELRNNSFFTELFSYNFCRVIKENHCFLLTIYLKFLGIIYNYQYTGDSLCLDTI